MNQPFLTMSDYNAARRPPVRGAQPLSDADQAAALRCSTAIFQAVKAAQLAVNALQAREVTALELIGFYADPTAAMTAMIEPARHAVVRLLEARKEYIRLVQLLGEDGSVPDHGWGNGFDSMFVASIEEAIGQVEAQLAPLAAADKLLHKNRRAVA